MHCNVCTLMCDAHADVHPDRVYRMIMVCTFCTCSTCTVPWPEPGPSPHGSWLDAVQRVHMCCSLWLPCKACQWLCCVSSQWEFPWPGGSTQICKVLNDQAEAGTLVLMPWWAVLCCLCMPLICNAEATLSMSWQMGSTTPLAPAVCVERWSC